MAQCCGSDGTVEIRRGEAIVLVGNPNVGKSVIFGYLTGRYVTVANYPGTTVEIATGKSRWNGRVEQIVDTPGVNSLLPVSEEERVTRDILLHGQDLRVVQVADAKNLRRALMLSVQLAELGVPFVLDLNMIDEARQRGIEIDEARLARQLGAPVTSTVAIRKEGLSRLLELLQGDPPLATIRITYPEPIETAVAQMTPLLPDSGISRRGLAVMILAGDPSLDPYLHERLSSDTMDALRRLREQAEAQTSQPLRRLIQESRQKTVQELLDDVFSSARRAGPSMADRISTIVMHPVWGVPVVLAILLLIYGFVGVFGAGTLVDLLEIELFGNFLVPWSVRLIDWLIPVPLLRDLLVGDYGLISMALTYSIAIVLPVVGTFFLAFGLLEDSGYLPRLAVMLNRVFRAMGLNGKAVLPMVLGLGCDTMATLTTRILETRKERVQVTLLLALGVPCSAQLGVVLGMLGGLSATAMMFWLFVVLCVLLTVGYLASKVIPGSKSDFILELPPIRWPSPSNLVVKTLARIEWYLKEAVPLFFLGTLLLFVLAKTGGLALIERAAAPLVQGLLGLPAEATESFLVGFLRRDYGAAGLFQLARNGMLDSVQVIVSLVTITLFVPCIANLFIIIKERGLATGMAIFGFIVPFAFAVGALVNWALRAYGVAL
jgi:ferrous iron transport protein B